MPQKDPALSWAKWRKLDFLSFTKIYPRWGVNPKKYFEVTNRVQGEVHAKFGWNPSSSLGSKSEQTNKQTNRPVLYIYILFSFPESACAGSLVFVSLQYLELRLNFPMCCTSLKNHNFKALNFMNNNTVLLATDIKKYSLFFNCILGKEHS